MSDSKKTRDELLEEVEVLRARVAELERREDEHIRTDKALDESRSRFQAMADLLPESIYETDDRGNITFINSTASEVFGYTLDDFKRGMSPLDIFVAEDRERAAVNLQKRLKGERGSSIEYTGVKKDGARFPVILHASPIWEGDRCVGSRGVIVDITEQKRAEINLRESEERFRNLAEFLPGVSIQGYGTDGIVFYWNKASEDVYGYTGREAIGRNLADLIIPSELRHLFIEGLGIGGRTTKSGELMPPGELQLLHKDGHLVPVYSIHTAVCIEGGKPLMFCIDVDLSERKRVEAELQDALSRFEAVVENMPMVAIQSFDRDGVIRVWNAASEHLYGYTSKEAIGKRIQDILLTGKTKAEFKQTLAAVFESGRATLPHEWLAETRDGEKRWIYSTMFPILRDGDIGEVFCTDVDITERKHVEEQLRQSQKMEAVGHLAGGIAHDFNNILQAIIGYTQLAMGAFTSDQRGYEDLNAVLGASRKATELTRQLLAFSRRQVLQATDVDLRGIVTELTKMLGRIIPENVQLVTDIPGNLSCVHADRAMIEQMLMNLCVNARDAMPEGGLLTVSAVNVNTTDALMARHPGLTPGRHVLVSVTDTGTGIEPEVIEHIYEPFFTTKQVGQGSGLGLAMVYGIVKQHGGVIDVESEPGKGSAFNIYIPAVEREPAVFHKPVRASTPGGTETILFAEDEWMVRDLAARVLREGGYNVLLAEDGQEAMRLFEENIDAIDLALLDVVMPKLSGTNVAEKIRERRPNINVLFSSGYNPDGSQPGFVLKEGMQLLPKPYTPDKLLRKVREVLDRSRGSSQ